MLREVVPEFLSALVARTTYQPGRNTYILFGLFWGLPVPILGYLIERHGGPPRSWFDLLGDPLHIFLALHPIFFAIVFGALGTIRMRKMARIQTLLDRRAEQVQLLSRANADLRELDRLKDEFLSNVTHELKTPLVTMRGYTEMLISGRLGELNPKQRKASEVMERNASRLQEQIDRILSAGRDRKALQGIEKKETPLNDVVLESIDRHTPAAEAKGVTLQAQLPRVAVMIWGDHERLVEVFGNLLSNAIKFTERGGRVWIGLGEPEGRLIPVEVGDTGCGIPDDAREHIFDRFRQADGSIRRRFGGSGLGLAIVRHNLELHGSTIRLDSAEGAGSRFRFDLPLAPAQGGDR